MPIQVKLPDGSVGDFPDGMPDHEIESVLQRQYGTPQAAPQAAPEAKPLGGVATFIGNAAQSALLNYGDEAGALLKSAFIDGKFGQNFGDTYEANLKQYRDNEKADNRENPGSALAGTIAGTLPYAFAAAPRAGLSTLGRVADGLKIGGATGAAQGFGSSEGGTGNRVQGAVTGGLLGGALGGAIPGVLGAGKTAGGLVYNGLGLGASEKIAADRVVGQFARDGISLDDAAAQAARATGLGKPAFLGDFGGRNVTAEARRVFQTPGSGGETVRKGLLDRAAGQQDRLEADLGATVADTGSFYDSLGGLAARKQSEATPLYDAAYAAPFKNTPELQDLLARPGVKDAVREMHRLDAIRGVKTPVQMAGDDVTVEPSLKGWDYIKKALDTRINAGQDAVTGKYNDEAKAFIDLKGQLTGQLDSLVPEYAQARATFGGLAHSEQAVKEGRKIANKDPEAIAKQVAGMSPTDQQFYRIGAARQLRDAMGNRAAGSDATGLLTTPNTQRRLGGLLGDERLGQLNERVDLERRFADQKRAITGGSLTASNLSQAADANTEVLSKGAQFFGDLAGGRFMAAAGKGLGLLSDRAKGITEPVNEQIASYLYSLPADEAVAQLKKLNKTQLKQLREATGITPERLTRGSGLLSGGVGSYAGQK